MQVIEQTRVGCGSAANDWWLKLVDLLPPADRQLLEVWSEGTVSLRTMAKLMDCSHGTVCRRLRRLRNRLSGEVVRMLALHGEALPQDLRHVALGIFVRGESMYVVARRTALSRAELKQALAEIRGWARGRALAEREAN